MTCTCIPFRRFATTTCTCSLRRPIYRGYSRPCKRPLSCTCRPQNPSNLKPTCTHIYIYYNISTCKPLISLKAHERHFRFQTKQLIPMCLTPSTTVSPPWEVIVLVAHRLDPKSLAVASCVCKSWSISMSSDDLWKPICNTHFPSISNLYFITDFIVPHHRLYAIGHAAAKRRVQTPCKPRLSLGSLIFTVNILTKKSRILTLAKPCEELLVDPNGVFKFDIDVNYERSSAFEALEDVKITWNVVLRGWRGVFTMMDCEGTVSFSPGSEGWFSDELPSTGCCSSAAASGIVADLKMGFCGRRESSGGVGKVKARKVSVGILSIVNWRYVSVDDGLRYLQHFLLPCDV
jgi:hypothetical protein